MDFPEPFQYDLLTHRSRYNEQPCWLKIRLFSQRSALGINPLMADAEFAQLIVKQKN